MHRPSVHSHQFSPWYLLTYPEIQHCTMSSLMTFMSISIPRYRWDTRFEAGWGCANKPTLPTQVFHPPICRPHVPRRFSRRGVGDALCAGWFTLFKCEIGSTPRLNTCKWMHTCDQQSFLHMRLLAPLNSGLPTYSKYLRRLMFLIVVTWTCSSASLGTPEYRETTVAKLITQLVPWDISLQERSRIRP